MYKEKPGFFRRLILILTGGVQGIGINASFIRVPKIFIYIISIASSGALCVSSTCNAIAIHPHMSCLITTTRQVSC